MRPVTVRVILRSLNVNKIDSTWPARSSFPALSCLQYSIEELVSGEQEVKDPARPAVGVHNVNKPILSFWASVWNVHSVKQFIWNDTEYYVDKFSYFAWLDMWFYVPILSHVMDLYEN